MSKNHNLQEQLLVSLDDRQLNLIILPTEKCNFRCTYCYEDFSIGKMSKTTQEAIKKFLRLRMKDLRLLEISWFGGEPLLAKEIIYDLSKFIIREKPNNLNFIANITTNAYKLNSVTFKELIKCNVVKFHISLDGDYELHNKSRILANGEGTFEKIWDSILMMHNSKFHFELIIRVHFTVDNYKKHLTLIDKLNQFLCEDNRIKIYFKAIERLGGQNDNEIKQLKHSQK